MYPLCCIDIRNFLNQFYFFSDDHFQHPNVIDQTLKTVSRPDGRDHFPDENFANIATSRIQMLLVARLADVALVVT